MKIDTSWVLKTQRSNTLPVEMHARLQSIARQPNYSDQANALSLAYPHSETEQYRWYLPHQELPNLHCMETRDSGNHLILHILIPRMRSILTLEKHFSDWEIASIRSEHDIDDILPYRFNANYENWQMRASSWAQMRTVAKQLSLPIQRVPRLSAYNAQIILQTTIAMRHFPNVRKMIAAVHWETSPSIRRKHPAPTK